MYYVEDNFADYLQKRTFYRRPVTDNTWLEGCVAETLRNKHFTMHIIKGEKESIKILEDIAEHLF